MTPEQRAEKVWSVVMTSLPLDLAESKEAVCRAVVEEIRAALNAKPTEHVNKFDCAIVEEHADYKTMVAGRTPEEAIQIYNYLMGK